MNMPGLTAEFSLHTKDEHYRVGLSTNASRRDAVVPAYKFKILTRGHVGYCCSCNDNNSGCDCEACLSV
jgi:hypothetical protein